MKYVLFFVKSNFVDAIYSELYDDKNVLLYRDVQNKIINKIRNIHTSMKLNKYFTVPFQGIWKHTFFNENALKNDDECIFIFDEGNKQAYNKMYLDYLKRRYKKALFCFRYWNPADCLAQKYIDFVDAEFDLIISYDPEDCKKHGWVYYSGTYSKPRVEEEAIVPNYDVFFVGYNKGRLEKLRILYNSLTEIGLKCDFYISEVEEGDCLNDGIHYNEYLSYSDVIKHVKNSKSILEVLQECQHGNTLRTMEAIVYKRILITNNRDVRTERYFSEKQFYVVDNINCLDPNEITRRCSDIDKLNYDGELSPYLFLDFLTMKYANILGDKNK